MTRETRISCPASIFPCKNMSSQSTLVSPLDSSISQPPCSRICQHVMMCIATAMHEIQALSAVFPTPLGSEFCRRRSRGVSNPSTMLNRSWPGRTGHGLNGEHVMHTQQNPSPCARAVFTETNVERPYSRFGQRIDGPFVTATAHMPKLRGCVQNKGSSVGGCRVAFDGDTRMAMQVRELRQCEQPCPATVAFNSPETGKLLRLRTGSRPDCQGVLPADQIKLSSVLMTSNRRNRIRRYFSR